MSEDPQYETVRKPAVLESQSEEGVTMRVWNYFWGAMAIVFGILFFLVTNWMSPENDAAYNSVFIASLFGVGISIVKFELNELQDKIDKILDGD